MRLLTLDDLGQAMDQVAVSGHRAAGSFVIVSTTMKEALDKLFRERRIGKEKERLLHKKRFAHLTKREFERILIKE